MRTSTDDVSIKTYSIVRSRCNWFSASGSVGLSLPVPSSVEHTCVKPSPDRSAVSFSCEELLKANEVWPRTPTHSRACPSHDSSRSRNDSRSRYGYTAVVVPVATKSNLSVVSKVVASELVGTARLIWPNLPLRPVAAVLYGVYAEMLDMTRSIVPVLSL